MYRIFNPRQYLYYMLLILVGSHFFSCAYFNTFYNAESSYKKALHIIEESPILNELEVSKQAKKLLAEAIENSKDVLKKYPDSKYVDDAVYIIAKSSFLRDEVAVAATYFNQLLRDYPESEFHSLSEIWLTYSHLRLDMVEKARLEIESIRANTHKGREKLYLINNILAEIALIDGNINNTYLYYEKAAEYAPTKSKKISTYGKLVFIAETNQNKMKASEYLVSLGDVAPEKIRINARMKWITYQRELGNYDSVISEIERMLGMAEFAPENMQMELELGKVYQSRGNIELAKDIFGLIVEKYTKKEETAEAYFQLGFIALMEDFNLDLAGEYFESSRTEKASSFYGRESKDFLTKITRFENLQSLYKDVVTKHSEEVEYREPENLFDQLRESYNEQKDLNKKINIQLENNENLFSIIEEQIIIYTDLNNLKENYKIDESSQSYVILNTGLLTILSEMKELIQVLDPDSVFSDLLNVKSDEIEKKDINKSTRIDNIKIDDFIDQSIELVWELDNLTTQLDKTNAMLYVILSQLEDVSYLYRLSRIKDDLSSVPDDLNQIVETAEGLLIKTSEISSEIKSLSFFDKIKAKRELSSTTKSIRKVPRKVEIVLNNYQLILQNIENSLFNKDELLSSLESNTVNDSLAILLMDRVLSGFLDVQLSMQNIESKNMAKLDNRSVKDRGSNFSDSSPSNDKNRNSNTPMDFKMNTMLNDIDITKEDADEVESDSANPDSVLFIIGEMLIYDFNHLELSLDKFKTLIEEYPQSRFVPQALYVLSYFEPDRNWLYQLESFYPNSSFLNPDSVITDTSIRIQMEIKRDYAWSLAENSYEESYQEFRRLYDEKKDTLSAYISAYISDYYLNDIRRSIKYYQAFIDSFPDHSYYSQVDDRLKSIKTDLEIQKVIFQQGLDYASTVQYFQEEKDFDSTQVLLDKIVLGEDSQYKDAANRLKIVIRNYHELVEEINTHETPVEKGDVDQMMAMPKPDIGSKKDSLIYLLAELFTHELEFMDSASYYHHKLVSSYSDSKFRPYSMMTLEELDSSGIWEVMLQEDYPDTSFAPDSIGYQIAYHAEIFQDDFLSNNQELIQLCDNYLELFPKLIDSSLFLPDTTITMDDSLVMPSDTISIPVDTLIMPSDTISIPVDTLIMPSDTMSISGDTLIMPLDTTFNGILKMNKDIKP